MAMTLIQKWPVSFREEAFRALSAVRCMALTPGAVGGALLLGLTAAAAASVPACPAPITMTSY